MSDERDQLRGGVFVLNAKTEESCKILSSLLGPLSRMVNENQERIVKTEKLIREAEASAKEVNEKIAQMKDLERRIVTLEKQVSPMASWYDNNIRW